MDGPHVVHTVACAIVLFLREGKKIQFHDSETVSLWNMLLYYFRNFDGAPKNPKILSKSTKKLKSSLEINKKDPKYFF